MMLLGTRVHPRCLVGCSLKSAFANSGRLSGSISRRFPSKRYYSRPSHVTSAVASPEAVAPTKSTVPAPVRYDLVCPICLETELKVSKTTRGQTEKKLGCSRCQRTFAATTTFVDLTLTSGVTSQVYKQSFWGGTKIFESPIVSYIYERGWRQGFKGAGFPGADEEFRIAMGYLQPAFGETLVDMSCGSGLFARRFVGSGKFSKVIAADYSENMLGQASQFFSQDASLDPSKFLLLRADVGRLPFATSSLAALHAGAAIHCWPNPTAAVAEISRVLKPGGVFVASTFLNFTAPLGEVFGDANLRPLNQVLTQIQGPLSGTAAYRWWEEAELKDLTATMGLVDFRRKRTSRFIMFSVRKPGGSMG